MIQENPTNLSVPLMNVSQSCIPNLSWKTVESRLGKDSNLKQTEKSFCWTVSFKGAGTFTSFPSLLYRAGYFETESAAPGFQEYLYPRGLSVASPAGNPPQ